MQGANESIEKSQGASHAADVGGTFVLPYDLANGTHANELKTQ